MARKRADLRFSKEQADYRGWRWTELDRIGRFFGLQHLLWLVAKLHFAPGGGGGGDRNGNRSFEAVLYCTWSERDTSLRRKRSPHPRTACRRDHTCVRRRQLVPPLTNASVFALKPNRASHSNRRASQAIRRGLAAIRTCDVLQWCQEHLGLSVQGQRSYAYQEQTSDIKLLPAPK